MAHRKKREKLTGYLFISPFIIGFVCFISIPMLLSLIFSFNFRNLENTKEKSQFPLHSL